MRTKHSYLLLSLVFLGLAFANSAQSYEVLVRPEDAIVEPGAGLKFEAHLFSENGTVTVPNEQFEWKVIPENLGTITDDGFFIAGREPGRGEIIAMILFDGQRFAGTAHVIVGAPKEPDINIIIRPKEALVLPTDTLRFVALARGPGGIALRWNSVRWMVEPRYLGAINNHGLFTASERLGAGRVIALVEIDHQVYQGEAKLVVSPKPTSAIAGLVTDDAGSVLADAKVTAHRIGKIRWHRKAQTDENGEYRIDKLIPGYYVVRAEAENYVAEYYDNVRYLNEALPVQLADADTVGGIDFALNQGGSITGLVTADEGDLPLAGAHVKASLLVNPKHRIHALAGDDGTFKLSAVPTGSYVVQANLAGYKGEFYDDVKNLEDAMLVRVEEPNETNGIDFGLETASAISGFVTNEVDGSPIAGAEVAVLSLLSDTPTNRPPSIIKSTRSTEDGSYTLQVKPGFYLVAAIAKGFSHEWYDDAETPQTATPVQVFEDQHTEGIDLDLWPLGAISGTVVDQESGEPIVGARVKAFREQPGCKSKAVLTDDQGAYIIENLPAGEYVVKSKAQGYLPEFWEEAEKVEDATRVTVENAHTVDGINFTLKLGGTVTGVVLSEEDNLPIVGALIQLKSTTSRKRFEVKSDGDGLYLIEGLPTDTYIAKANAKGFKSEWFDNAPNKSEATEFEVAEGQTTENIDFSLARHPWHGGSITGLVIDDSTEAPIEGAQVIAIQMLTGRLFRGVSGPEGDYRVDGLRPGLYVVLSWAEGYLAEFYNDAHRWWKADPVMVMLNEEKPNIDFALTPRAEGAYMIAGTITTRSGEPVEGALVQATNEIGVVATDLSEEDGTYSFHDMPAGTYKLSASVVGYEDGYYGGSSEDTATEISVGAGMNVENANLTAGVQSTDVESEESTVPRAFALSQNFPNPFNPTTEIKYDLPMDADVTLKVYNLLGEEVATLVEARRVAGSHNLIWNGTDTNGRPMASGMYIYRIEAQSVDGSSFVQSHRMVLLK